MQNKLDSERSNAPVHESAIEGELKRIVSSLSQGSGNWCSGVDVWVLAVVAGVAEGVAAGLREDAEAVGAVAYFDAVGEFACCCIEAVDFVVVAAGDPEHPAVGGDAAHVGRAAACLRHCG